MKSLNALVCLLAGLAMNAQAGTAARNATVVPQKVLACTKDLNAWGHASRCGCPKPTKYDQRIGACYVGKFSEIMVSGAIHSDVMAPGGETTGFQLQTFEGDVSYDLVLKTVDQNKLSQHSGLPFEVVGDLIDIPGVETGTRTAIIVKELHWLD